MNRVNLIGRLTRDPEMRTTASGIAVTRFTIAVDRVPSSQGNNNGPTADFISCVVWRKPAENVAKYCSKGSQVGVEGRIQTGSFDGQDGQRRYTTEVVCDRVEFIGSRTNNSSSSFEQDAEPSYSNNSNNDNSTADVSEDPFKDFGDEISLSDDDLPF